MYLQQLRMLAVFEDFDSAVGLLCDSEGGDSSCDILEAVFPIRDYLVPTLIELCEKEILGVNYRIKEDKNNATDDTAKIVNGVAKTSATD